MGLGVTYGGMPPFFVFSGQRIFDGYLSILGGIGPRNRVREEWRRVFCCLPILMAANEFEIDFLWS